MRVLKKFNLLFPALSRLKFTIVVTPSASSTIDSYP